jgi:hypothetical protein
MPRISTSLLLAVFIVTVACSRSADVPPTMVVETETEEQNHNRLLPMPGIEEAWRAGEVPEGPAEPPRPGQVVGLVSIHLIDDFPKR